MVERNCARCGKPVDANDGYLVRSEDGSKDAALCRLEHIVAWVMRGASWQFEEPWNVAEADRMATGAVVVERHRGGTVTEEAFPDAEALRAWASAGGAWAR